MFGLKQYGIDKNKYSITTGDLIVIANIEKNNNIDTVITDILSENTIVIKGIYNIDNKYAVCGSEIVFIESYITDDDATRLTIKRRQFGTRGTYAKGSKFRTVIMTDNNEDIILTGWEFEDTMGNVSSSLFPVELGTGTISLKSDLSLWSPHSILQKYKVRNKKTTVYIFKGVDGIKILKFATLVSRVRFSTKGKSEPSKITLDIKTKLSQWYDKEVAINKQLKGSTPKDFFKLIFGLSDDEVYYADGVDENSFPKINNLHTKEYNNMSDLLKAYCQNGIRFCFDKNERVKIFGDFNIDNIDTDRVLDYDITDAMLTEDEQMIYNTINTQSVQRQTLYNFEELNNKYVSFFKVKKSAVNSSKFLKIDTNSEVVVNSIEIVDADVHSSVQLKDYVLFKMSVAPYKEFYARVVSIESNNKVVMIPILYDKDFKLFNYGKNVYLKNLLINNPCAMDLYYVKKELPMIFKLTRKKGDEEIDSSLMMPLLPRIDGETKYQNEINCTFGSASNLKIGSYTGIVEETDKIYGTWDNSKLLYNMELEQFSNTDYPPIFALSNKVNERLTTNNTPILNYTSFDNSDLLVEISRPSDSSCDAILKLSNTKSINSDMDLYIGKEIGRLGNKIIQVDDISHYNLGDVLIVNKPSDLTNQEELEFDEVLSSIRWTILGKETQVGSDGKRRHYIFLDSNFAKRQKTGTVYEFTKFPNTSIVFLQELYFRGNPVIEYAQDITGLSKGATSDGDTSRDLYGEKKYELEAKQLNKEGLRLLMGYILEHFQATSPQTTKFNVPISVFNAIDIELLDVVKINDPLYTQIKEDMKWIVVSISMKGGTNEVQLKLLNLNSKNTVPYKIDIKDVIEYNPIDIPNYDHNGGEGSDGVNNDGSGGTDIDATLGQFWLSEVDPQKFRAKVDRFEGNYIYFKDFSGEQFEEYQSKLFPVSEFAVNIKGEVIFVQSDMNYRAFIKKRRVYDTEEVLIAPEDDVSFLVTTTYVDVDGTFYGRKMMMGDGDNYLSVDPIKGVKIVGDFVVGENNQNSSNDLWQALNKNRTFQQKEAPKSDSDYTLRNGDIWYDTDDDNHCYRYDGSVWVSARDNSVVSLANTVFLQPEPPADKEGRPIVNGDTWYDTDDGNKPYIYQDGEWINVTDSTLQEAIDNVEKTANESMERLEDISDDNKVVPSEKTQVQREWEQIQGEYSKILKEAVKLGVSATSYQTNYNTLNKYITPILSNMYETTTIDRSVFKSNFNNYYNNRQDLLNNISTKIKELADNAQKDATTALGNAKIFYQTEPPVSNMKENDLWYDTDDGNHPYIYQNGQWVSARDKVFETASGNKVYFQPTEPPTNTSGAKEGDQWFDTANNNTQYVLVEENGYLQWVLASDANDKIAKGRIVLNANTTINGDFKVSGGNVELDGDTMIKGILEVFSNNQGIISYNGIDEASSTQRIIIRGGEILFQERIL